MLNFDSRFMLSVVVLCNRVYDSGTIIRYHIKQAGTGYK